MTEILKQNTELLINESHSNKFIMVLDKIPSSYLLSKFANPAKRACINLLKNKLATVYDKATAQELLDIQNDYLQEQNQDIKNVQLYIQSVTLPGIDLDVSRMPTQFVTIPHVSGKLNFGDLTMSIISDENMMIYQMLYYWFLNAHNPTEYNKLNEMGYYKAFYVSGTLIFLNNHLEKVWEVRFSDLHPIGVGELPLNYTDAQKIYIPTSWIHTGFIPTDDFIIKVV